jgi:hypothetical protein
MVQASAVLTSCLRGLLLLALLSYSVSPLLTGRCTWHGHGFAFAARGGLFAQLHEELLPPQLGKSIPHLLNVPLDHDDTSTSSFPLHYYTDATYWDQESGQCDSVVV